MPVHILQAVDQDGEVVDVFVQTQRDGRAAKHFFRRLLKAHAGEPREIVTDRLGELRGRTSRVDPRLDSSHIPVCQQPSRALPSADAGERAEHASIQIDAAISAIPGCPLGRPQPINHGPALDVGRAPPIAQTACLCVLGIRDGNVIEIFPGVGTGSIVNLSVPSCGGSSETIVSGLL